MLFLFYNKKVHIYIVEVLKVIYLFINKKPRFSINNFTSNKYIFAWNSFEQTIEMYSVSQKVFF